ncbi:MAG TPA: bile acid:sodium symporter family protein [Pseudonocardiaceae bacterium]
MESSPLLTVLLPVALGTVMLGLGLSLTTADFTRVARSPRAVGCALACQLLLLPAVCFALVIALGLAPELAVGMMLLAASPGGTTANLYSHLSGGDVALNISLTAVNSVISVVTLPLVVNLSLGYFLDGDDAVGLRFGELLQVFAVVLLPVVVGMVLRNRYPAFAARTDRPVKILSAVFLVLVVVAAVLRERENILDFFGEVGLAALLFSVISLAVGYWVPRLLSVGRRQAIATSMEIGIHNSTLAIAIALGPTLLDNSRMAIPPAVYAIVAFITAGVFGYVVSRRREPVAV